jgi:uncharacterized protein (DUF58 family)
MDRKLSIGIALDASASMAYGQPDKMGFGAALVTALAFIGLAHGDSVHIGAGRAGTMSWFRGLHGTQQIDLVAHWFEGLRASGRLPLTTLAASMADRMPGPGLTFVLSDWWAGDAGATAALLRRAGHAVVAVHVLSPEEIDPRRLGGGPARLVDMETGDEHDRSLDAGTYRKYGAALTAFRERLEQELGRAGARYIFARSDAPLEDLLLREWRREGLIV